MAWIFVFSPNIGWGNAVLKAAFGLSEAPVNIYSMAGMTWALSSHYFPLAYLVLGPALRALDLRMEEAALMAGGSYPQVFATVTGKGYRPARIKLGRARWPVAVGIGAMFVFALGLPLVTLIWQSFFRNLAQPFVFTSARATLDNYEFILSYPIFLAAVKTSV